MENMISTTKRARAAAFAVVFAVIGSSFALPVSQSSASEIKYVVNNIPVTSYDIQRRVALNKLFRQKGGAEKATEDMIEQALKTSELQRRNVRIADAAVDQSYDRFATSNKLKPSQLARSSIRPASPRRT
jgi:peptidyl-prolyl cis-trans isomerase SurA